MNTVDAFHSLSFAVPPQLLSACSEPRWANETLTAGGGPRGHPCEQMNKFSAPFARSGLLLASESRRVTRSRATTALNPKCRAVRRVMSNQLRHSRPLTALYECHESLVPLATALVAPNILTASVAKHTRNLEQLRLPKHHPSVFATNLLLFVFSV